MVGFPRGTFVGRGGGIDASCLLLRAGGPDDAAHLPAAPGQQGHVFAVP